MAIRDVYRGPSVVWENRSAMVQTWVALQAYFTEKWLKQKQYLVMIAKQL